METFRHQRSPGSDRFLGLFSSTPPDANGGLSSSSIGDELDEDDIFATVPEPEPDPIRRNARNPVGKVGPNSHLTPSPLASAGGGRRAPERSFGILAALPEEDKNRHNFLHRKATVTAASSPLSTSPSSSGARVIPALPKPKAADFAISAPSGKIYHQSVPVNVPMVPPRARKVGWGEVQEDLEEEKDEDEDEMLPPHEIVARTNGSPMTTFSVLEGVGRTLKGRDLRQQILLGISMASLLAGVILILQVLLYTVPPVSASSLLKGSVACLDCISCQNISGVLVAVKCTQAEGLKWAYTDQEGSFEVQMPAKSSSSSADCLARILGGSEQFFSSEKYMISRIIKPKGFDSYTLAATLKFYTSIPAAVATTSAGRSPITTHSGTPSLPPPSGHESPPANWGLPPFIYLFPFFPIIGIP